MKRFLFILLFAICTSGLFAELLYEKGSDYNYLKLSFISPNNEDTYLIWAQESRELFSGNYNHYEITVHDKQKAYDLLLLLSESDNVLECLEKYSENNKNLVLQKEEIKISDYDNIIVYYYYELK